MLGPANTSVALSVSRSNCANPPHKLRKSLSQIAQTNPLNCANQRAIQNRASTDKARQHKGLWCLCGPSGAKTKPKRIATWSANETQNGAQRNTNGCSDCEYLDDEGAVYCTDPRLYVPLVFALIRWAPLCISFCAPCCVSFLRKTDNIGAANPCAAWLWPWLLSLGWLADLRNLGD